MKRILFKLISRKLRRLQKVYEKSLDQLTFDAYLSDGDHRRLLRRTNRYWKILKEYGYE